MTSPRFSLAGRIPALYKSALISIGGFTIAIAVFFGLKTIFPQADLSEIQAALIAVIGSWVVNTAKEYLTEK